MNRIQKSRIVLSVIFIFIMLFPLGDLLSFATAESAIKVVNVTYNQDVGVPEAAKVVASVTLEAVNSNTVITVKDLYHDTETSETVSTAGTEFTTPAGLLTTLTVDGVQYDFTDFTTDPFLSGSDVVITYTEDVYNLTNYGPGEGSGVYENFRSSLFVEDSVISDTASVKDAVTYSSVGTGIENAAIKSEGSNFNGILLKNSGTDNNHYTIDHANISLTGNGGDDFNGWGAGIMVTSTGGNTSYVDITNTYITTKGAIRTAIWAGGSGTTDVKVSDTVVIGRDADPDSAEFAALAVPMMKKVPWALGLEGNNRITGVLGNAQVSYEDSIIVAEGWGALSTDSASSTDGGLKAVKNVLAGIGSLEVYDEADAGRYTAVKEVNGVTYGFTAGTLGESSGYVSYADQGITNHYTDSEFYAPDYLMIIASGASGAAFTNITGITQRGGFMWHQTAGGALTLDDGSFTVDDTMFLIKSQLSDTAGSNPAYTDIVVDGTELNIVGDNAQSGVLLQLMPTDDTAGSPVAGTYTVPFEGPDTEKAMETIQAVNAFFTDVIVEGDIYNSMQYKEQDLNVTFSAASITGVISSSWSHHVDENGEQYMEGTVLDDTMARAYLYGGRIVNTASETVDNAVNLTLKSSAWTVTGTSYISGLVVDGESFVNGTIYYEGSEISVSEILEAYNGSIRGDIRVEPGANDTTTIVISETVTYADGLTIGENEIYKAPDGYLLTMTVNGMETAMNQGTYPGIVVIIPTKVISEQSITASLRNNFIETYRASVAVGADGYDAEASVGAFDPSILGGGTYDSAAGIFSNYYIRSGSEEDADGSPQFSAFIFDENSAVEKQDYIIENSTIELYTDADGTPTETNDFSGLGAAIIATGAVRLTLDNVLLHTSGVAKSGLVTSGVGSDSNLDKTTYAPDVLIKESTLISDGGTLYDGYQNTADTSIMVSPPWVLGFQGNSRTTNLLGYYATNTYVDSTIKAAGWAVLSTDACTAVKHTIINSILSHTTRQDGGYGVYAIGPGSAVDFYGADLDTATFAAVIREGDITFASYTAGDEKNITKLDDAETTAFSNIKSSSWTSGTKTTKVDSQFGVMFHASGGNTLNVIEGTEFNTMNAALLVRSLPVSINVDDAKIRAANGVILQQMDDEDGGNVDVSMVDGSPVFGDFTEEVDSTGWPVFQTSGTPGTGAAVNFTNVTLEGNIYNSTGIAATGKDLTVNLGKGASLTGVITSSLSAHVWMEWNEEIQRYDYMHDISNVPEKYRADAAELEVDGITYIHAGAYDIDAHYNIGQVVNKATNASSQNPVHVTLTDGAVWTVTGTSYLSSLTIDSESSIIGTNGKAVKITVAGSKMPMGEMMKAKTITGNIVIQEDTSLSDSTSLEG